MAEELIPLGLGSAYMLAATVNFVAGVIWMLRNQLLTAAVFYGVCIFCVWAALGGLRAHRDKFLPQR